MLYDVAPETAVQLKATCALPAVAVKFVGAEGTVVGAIGVPDCAGLEAVLSPVALTAVTMKKYCVPLFSPVLVYEATFPSVTFVPVDVVIPELVP